MQALALLQMSGNGVVTMGTQAPTEITKKAVNNCFLHGKTPLNVFNSLIYTTITPYFQGAFSYALNGIKGVVSARFLPFLP